MSARNAGMNGNRETQKTLGCARSAKPLIGTLLKKKRWCKMKEIIEINTNTIGNEEVNAVDARELHTFLESKQDFSTWIKNRIEKYEFVESIDYVLVHNFVEQVSGTKERIDYTISIDMAKELSMVENNGKGKEARRYFIRCEKELKASLPESKLEWMELNRLFDYNENTGILTWKVSLRGPVKAGDQAGAINGCGYVQIKIHGKIYLAHRIIWCLVYSYWPENSIDHKNRNRSDNRLLNLREVSSQCNMRNADQLSNNNSGVKGVCWVKRANRWKAAIMISKKSHHLGYFTDFTEAVYHRREAELCFGWPNCDTMSTATKYINDHKEDDITI